MFSGVNYDLAIYIELVSDNNGRKLGIQSLPNTALQSLVIPVGVKATPGEITFSAETLNLQDGVKVILEDRLTNTFTSLNEASSNYKVNLDSSFVPLG